MNNLYFYTAEIQSVYDGDTVTAQIDLGFRLHMSKAKLRLLGINTPEMRSKDPEEKKKAYAARDYVRKRILGKKVMIQSHGRASTGDTSAPSGLLMRMTSRSKRASMKN